MLFTLKIYREIFLLSRGPGKSLFPFHRPFSHRCVAVPLNEEKVSAVSLGASPCSTRLCGAGCQGFEHCPRAWAQEPALGDGAGVWLWEEPSVLLSSLTGDPASSPRSSLQAEAFGRGPCVTRAAPTPASWLIWTLSQRPDSLPWAWTCLVLSTLHYTLFPSLNLLRLPCSAMVGLPACPWVLGGRLPSLHREFLALFTLLKQHLSGLLSRTREVAWSYRLQTANEVDEANLKETVGIPADHREPVNLFCSVTEKKVPFCSALLWPT